MGPVLRKLSSLASERDFIAVKGSSSSSGSSFLNLQGTRETHTSPAGPRQKGSASAGLHGRVWRALPLPTSHQVVTQASGRTARDQRALSHRKLTFKWETQKGPT